MKQTLSILMVFVMLLSAVTIAGSHEDTDTTNGDDDNNGPSDGARERRDTIRVVQERFQERIQDVREDFVERAREFRDDHEGRIDALHEKKEELRDAVGERREDVKIELKERARLAITSNIDRIVERLLAARENADSNKSIERIDILIEKFENRRARLENQDVNGTTVVEVNNEVNHEAEDAEHESKTHFVRAILKQFDKLIAKLERFSERLSNIAGRLEGNGADVSSLREIIGKLNSQSEDLAVTKAEIEQDLEGAETREEKREVLRDAHGKLKEARVELRETFKEIQKAIIALRKEIRGDGDNGDDDNNVMNGDNGDDDNNVMNGDDDSNSMNGNDTNSTGDTNSGA